MKLTPPYRSFPNRNLILDPKTMTPLAPKLVKLSVADIMAWMPIASRRVAWDDGKLGTARAPCGNCPLAGLLAEILGIPDHAVTWLFGPVFAAHGYEAKDAVKRITEAADFGSESDSTPAQRRLYAKLKKVLA